LISRNNIVLVRELFKRIFGTAVPVDNSFTVFLRRETRWVL